MGCHDWTLPRYPVHGVHLHVITSLSLFHQYIPDIKDQIIDQNLQLPTWPFAGYQLPCHSPSHGELPEVGELDSEERSAGANLQ